MAFTVDEFEKKRDPLTYAVIGCAIEVHKQMGPGLLESIYEDCLCAELHLQRISFERQRSVPVLYKGISIESKLKYDLLIETTLLVEIKTVERLIPIHDAQLLSYMKVLKIHRGLNLNFNVLSLKDGVKRLVL